MPPPSQPSLGERVRATADRHGLAISSARVGDHVGITLGHADDFGPTPGVWQMRPPEAFDAAASIRAAIRHVRERYGDSGIHHVYGFPVTTTPTSEEDSVTMAPPNPYRDHGQDGEAMTPAEPLGTFDLDTLNRLLQERHWHGFLAGKSDAESQTRSQFARIHDEGFETGRNAERDRTVAQFGTRLHALHEFADKLTAPDAAYFEGDVQDALRLAAATLWQIIAEWNGEDPVREHAVLVPRPMAEGRPGDATPNEADRVELERLERFLRERLPQRAEPITMPGEEVVIEVAVSHGATQADIEQEVSRRLAELAEQQNGTAEA